MTELNRDLIQIGQFVEIERRKIFHPALLRRISPSQEASIYCFYVFNSYDCLQSEHNCASCNRSTKNTNIIVNFITNNCLPGRKFGESLNCLYFLSLVAESNKIIIKDNNYYAANRFNPWAEHCKGS